MNTAEVVATVNTTTVGRSEYFLTVDTAAVPMGREVFLAWKLARSRRAGLTYSSPGVGTANHFAGNMLASRLGVSMVHVPFRGAINAATEVAAGRVDFCLCSYSTVHGLLESKKLRAIAIASAQRDPLLPSVPTLGEEGLSGMDLNVWFGLVAPATVPDDVVIELSKLFQESIRSSDVAEQLESHHEDVVTGSSADFGKLIAQEIERYRPIVLDSGLRGSQR